VGLHADVRRADDKEAREDRKLLTIQEEYFRYKAGKARNIEFEMGMYKGGEHVVLSELIDFHTSVLDVPYKLQIVQIDIGTSTYDQIENDVKITMEAALGLIGGTMGLFTGFSVLSGVEILYYGVKFLWSLRSRATGRR
jgi:hypothetical protein